MLTGCRKNILLGAMIAILLGAIGVVLFLLSMSTSNSHQSFADDLSRLQTVDANFTAYSNFFTDVAEDEGAVYAYELLRQVHFPPNIDQHLLGHVVGDELYRQEGLAGMQYCTDDFRNACSHTIVIGALLEKGLEVFDEVNDVCHLAPGGSGAYTMCFHGFGHGVLAFTEYDMAKTVELCMRTGTEDYNNQEANECVGGAVMEMKDGIHDKELWEPMKAKFVDGDNPLSMCQADYMPEGAKERCYSYITPFLFDAAGANDNLPTPDIFPQSMAFCEKEPNDIYKTMCYRGFGKEFVVLSAAYNIQDFINLTDAQLEQNLDWCDLANNKEYALECKKEVLSSLYWGGENDPSISLRYCALWSEAEAAGCYSALFQNVSFYVPDESYRRQICADTPTPYQAECFSALGIQT